VLGVFFGFNKSDDVKKFTKQPTVIETTTVTASKERMETNLLIETLERLKSWPTIKNNADALIELGGIKQDAEKYINVIQLDFDDVQLFALQDEILEKKNVKISNEFGTWLFYKTDLSKRFDELVIKSKLDEGEFCGADFDCKSSICYKQECVEKIEGSISFPQFDFALNIIIPSNLQIPVYTIDGNDGNFKFLYAYEENGTVSQKFRAEDDGSIIHVPSNKAIAVEGSESFAGGQIKLKARDGTLEQQWVVFDDGSIKNKKSGLAITFSFEGSKLAGGISLNFLPLTINKLNPSVKPGFAFNQVLKLVPF
jgi:hypothetical protein